MRGFLLAGFLSSAAYVRGHPAPEARPGVQRRTIDINAFRLPALSEYINATVADASIDSSFSKRADYVDTASELVKSKVPGATFRVVQDHYVGANGIAHVVCTHYHCLERLDQRSDTLVALQANRQWT
jgi:extracellular elastinolytic metalloproteinase